MEPRLRRVLKLRDLVFYGIVLITPIAPVGVFGVASQLSRGHAAATIVIAMVAMMLTAASYGRMAVRYPAAGSAYTYVGRGLNPHLGFLAGWAMVLDYLIIPVINVAYLALTIQRVAPSVPYWVWATLAAAGMTALNLRGIRSTARVNFALLGAMSVVIAAFVALAVRYLLRSDGWGALFSFRAVLQPLHVLPWPGVHRDLAGRAHLHRLRRCYHAGRRSGRSEADRAAGYRAHLPGHRSAEHGRDLSGAASVAGLDLLHQHGDGVSRRHGARGRAAAVPGHGGGAHRVLLRQRARRAGRRGAAALRHGARRRPAPPLFRPAERLGRQPHVQHLADGSSWRWPARR